MRSTSSEAVKLSLGFNAPQAPYRGGGFVEGEAPLAGLRASPLEAKQS